LRVVSSSWIQASGGRGRRESNFGNSKLENSPAEVTLGKHLSEVVFIGILSLKTF
jgi:hypothetical protein